LKITNNFFIFSITLFFLCSFDTALYADSPATSTGVPCKTNTSPPFPDVSLNLVTSGLQQPVHMTHAGDNSKRLFITEQSGVVRILKNGRLNMRPFLDIRKRVKSGGETGLLSVAFHPSFKKNGRFFVNYTSSKGGLHTVISEFHAESHLDFAHTESERVILTVPQPFSNHNGGQIAFGPDGYLYAGFGDGGAGNDPLENGQNLATLLGTILRIDVDKKEVGKEYAIPQDNPFVSKLGAKHEIWAYGLRNPWRFSFDPVKGTMYAADVGQSSREEINVIEAGKNYGWNIMEGSICTPGVSSNCNTTDLTLPIAEYKRDKGISVIGGFVYRGSKIPDLCGAYLYGDFGSGRIWALQYQNFKVKRKKLLINTKFSISSFGTDEDFEIYVVNYSGSIYMLDFSRSLSFRSTQDKL